MKECFAGVNVGEGYGSTECGLITADDKIPYGVQYKLVDVPHLGYFTTHDPPQGEILVKTRQMISGYYGDDEATRKAFDAEGYFRTGDIGEEVAKGHVRVIGRVKNATKLANGEFVQVRVYVCVCACLCVSVCLCLCLCARVCVALIHPTVTWSSSQPERIELVLSHSPLVRNVHIHASPGFDNVVALVVPNEGALREALSVAEVGLDGMDAATAPLKALCAHASVRQLVMVRVGNQGSGEGLLPYVAACAHGYWAAWSLVCVCVHGFGRGS